MSTIKNLLLPDSSLVCGILLCLFILSVKFYFGPRPEKSRGAIESSQSEVISQLTDAYLERLERAHGK